MTYHILSGICMALLIIFEFHLRKAVGKKPRFIIEIVSFLFIAALSYVQFFHTFQQADVSQVAFLLSFFLIQILCDSLFKRVKFNGIVD